MQMPYPAVCAPETGFADDEVQVAAIDGDEGVEMGINSLLGLNLLQRHRRDLRMSSAQGPKGDGSNQVSRAGNPT